MRQKAVTPRRSHSPTKIIKKVVMMIVSPFQDHNKRAPTRGNSNSLKIIDKSSTEEQRFQQIATIRQAAICLN